LDTVAEVFNDKNCCACSGGDSKENEDCDSPDPGEVFREEEVE